MDELTPRDVDTRFGALVGAFGWEDRPANDPAMGVPALLVRRLRVGDPAPAGARARFLMTTFEDGELTAYGWRADLRIGSPEVVDAPGLKEPGVQLVEEREYYLRSGETSVCVDISRVWVEELVRVPSDQISAEGSWLRPVLEDPNAPRVEPLSLVAGRPHLLGSRLVRALANGRYDVDLRAVSGPVMSSDGTLAVAAVSEAQWYRWHQGSYTETDRTVGHIPATELWVE
ncbi:hypothetical protein GCM10009858_43690 [Terrabacter carboxydivorans]|uniref:Maltokinase N-terminal cap domain-containing protein n=2 Tax=Terrabacter carboxydivorans TaxID=619730 RepID=A0ABN3MEX4_9MICO